MLLNQTVCAEGCRSDCATYVLPTSRCYNPVRLFPHDSQWGAADIVDELVNLTHLNRSFFASDDVTCQHRTDGFMVPLDVCVGPFGKPRPTGSFTTILPPPSPPPPSPIATASVTTSVTTAPTTTGLATTSKVSATLIDVDATSDEGLCHAHVIAHAKDVRRPPKGVLKHPYLVPAGPYSQLWDWDAVFLGVATISYGNRPYLQGSMRNFFDATNLSSGCVTGCLTTTLPTVCSSSPREHDGLVHAKPILIQGAWLAAIGRPSPAGRTTPTRRHTEEIGAPLVGAEAVSTEAVGAEREAFISSWQVYAPAMEALLDFWDRPPRRDPASGLRTWHDQMESGEYATVSERAACSSPTSECSATLWLSPPSPPLALHESRFVHSVCLLTRRYRPATRCAGADNGVLSLCASERSPCW